MARLGGGCVNLKIQNFPRKLRSLMNNHELNQIQLAEKIEVRQSQVSNYLNGKSFPTMYNLLRLAQCFKCDIEEFYRKAVD